MEQVTDEDKRVAFRRKRVQRLKKMIIASVLFLLLIPIVSCIILFVRVQSLRDQISGLTEIVQKIKRDELLRIQQSAEETLPPVPEREEEPVQNGPEEDRVTDPPEEYKRKVYLTFDDGPGSSTNEILDILAAYDVKATFFVVGKTDENSKECYRRIVREGHTLAMHSYSHKYRQIYASEEAFAEDFRKLQEYLYEVTGVWCRYTRFPGGSSNSVSEVDMSVFIDWLDERGITYFDWNASAGDSAPGGVSAEQVVSNCMKDIRKHDNVIVLLHDSGKKKTTVDALPELIETILEMEDTAILPITDETVPVQHINKQKRK